MTYKIFKLSNSEEWYISFTGRLLEKQKISFSVRGFVTQQEAEKYLDGGKPRLKEIFDAEKKKRKESPLFQNIAMMRKMGY